MRRLLPLLAAVVLLAGCGGAAASGRPQVVATTTQLADVVRAVGGDAVDVHQILQPNTDPHEYEPRPADVKATADARLVFASGNGLDHWIGDVVEQSGGDARTLTLAPVREDPHWWQDPRAVERVVPRISAALAGLAPAQKAAIARRARAYTARLRALDAGIAACMSRVPPVERKLVTSHDAFGAFARRYDITVVGAVIPSQSTEAQPSAGQVSDLARLVRREHVKAIFPESSLNPKLAEALARQTGARADLTLYGDSLGPRGSNGDTYLKMQRANADAMVRGFTAGTSGCPISR
jgi:zinc/manganese transport system substrate-binding protein